MTWDTSNRRAQLPPGWSSRIVPRIKRRDGHRCTNCGNTERLEVHHIRDRNDHRDANLATLCHQCHQAETQTEAAQARAQQPNRKRPTPPHPGLKRT